MTFETVTYEPGPVARVILNRPERHNAQSWKLLAELEDALNTAAADSEVRVIVLSGAGESFSAGHDLDSADQAQDRRERMKGLDGRARAELFTDIYIESHLRSRNLPKPTIAMVHGLCIFGGWMIASAMDVIFASEDALLIPVYGDYFTACWDLGARKAKEILYENRFMTADEAMTWGFVNRVYPAASLEAETLRYAARVADHNPRTTRTIKSAINAALDRMGFSESVKAIGADFDRMFAQPRRRPAAPRGAAAREESPFRNEVERAMHYLIEDGVVPPRTRPSD